VKSVDRTRWYTEMYFTGLCLLKTCKKLFFFVLSGCFHKLMRLARKVRVGKALHTGLEPAGLSPIIARE